MKTADFLGIDAFILKADIIAEEAAHTSICQRRVGKPRLEEKGDDGAS